jgi:FixJ family two-component response regulator
LQRQFLATERVMTYEDSVSLVDDTDAAQRWHRVRDGGHPRSASSPSASVIAVVDDNRAVLESMSDLLNSAGYDTRAFSSAREFLDSRLLHSIACLVTDVHLMGMDGWELRSVAQEQCPGLCVILISGDDATVRKARELQSAGVTHLLLKPFNGQELLDATRNALEAKSR